MFVSNKIYESNATWFQNSQGSYGYFTTYGAGNQYSKKFRENTYSMTYDTKGRFPLTKTNPMGWTETFNYDSRTGQVVKAWDVNDLLTKYQYDGFGRNVLTEYPDGTNSQQSLHWYSGTGISNACYYSQSQASASPPAKTWYDRMGREILSQGTAFDGQLVDVKTEYDDLGRLWKVSEPFFDANNPTQFTVSEYDPLGRNFRTTLPTGVQLVTDYTQLANNTIITKKTYDTETWETVTKTMNAFGQPASVVDIGGEIVYAYNSAGLPKSITSNGATVTMTYDIHGNRISIDDPDANEIITTYNAYDELVSQTDAREHTYNMTYDKLGRILTRLGDENTTWTYSDTPGHLGELETVTTNNGTAQSYSYDALGRVTLQTETVSGQDFTKSYSYDSYGRVQTETWNTGFGIQNTYNQHGYLSSIKTSNNQLIWQPNAYNVRGQLTNYLQGTNLITQKYYDGYGFQTGDLTSATGVGTYAYNSCDFDEIKGNMMSRTDHLTSKTEYFRYDNLNRIIADSISSSNFRNTLYSANGNITNRSDIGTYTYDDAGPHAVTGLTSTTGSLLPANDQTIDYTAFNKASHIGQGNLDYFITYGPDRLRRRTQLNSGIGDDMLLTKYYAFGDYEKEITPSGTRHLHYISSGDGLAAIYVKYSNAPDSLYFITTDQLGSIVGAINSATGTVYRQNFDAWGRKRNPITLSYTNIPDFPFDRGYTGHEHLKWFGLINMNGRMYDAALCRFLSPDPFVQHPGYSQSYNRYTYCLNNPLKYNDPSGYFDKPSDWDAPPVYSTYYFGPGYKGGNGLQPVFSEPIGYDGFIHNIHEGKGVHYDPGNGHYYDNEGNIISSQQALNNYSSNQLEVTWLFFSGTEQNPFKTLTGAEFSDNSSVYFFDGNAADGGGGINSDMTNYVDYTEGLIGLGQIGLMDYRQSQPIMSRIGNFSNFSKTYRFLGATRNVIGGASTYVGTPLSIGLNANSLYNGEIGVGTFSYRTTGDISAVVGGIYIGAQFGGPWGAAGGALITGTFWVGEQIYDALIFTRDKIGQFSNDFNNAVSSGTWYPGR